MPNETTFVLHEKLIAWQVACELLRVVRDARISDAKLRDQAMRAAQSTCLNIAEANGRFSRADRGRVFAIARGEAAEAWPQFKLRPCREIAARIPPKTRAAMARGSPRCFQG